MQISMIQISIFASAFIVCATIGATLFNEKKLELFFYDICMLYSKKLKILMCS